MQSLVLGIILTSLILILLLVQSTSRIRQRRGKLFDKYRNYDI